MRTRKLMGIPVLHIQAGVQLGRVCGFCVDPDSRRVAALLVKTKGLKWGRRVLAVSDVFGLGSDAVTVRDAECLKKLKDAGRRPGTLQKWRRRAANRRHHRARRLHRRRG